MTARRWWNALAVATLSIAAIAVGLRFVPILNRPMIAAVALAPYLMLGAPVAAIVFGALRRWPATLAALVMSAVIVGVQMPVYVGEAAPDGVTIRFVSANLRYGNADAEDVMRVFRENADVVAVQELTPQAAQRLEPLRADFPFQALTPREGPAGVGIWSRYPITGITPVDGFWLGLLTARVRIPDVGAETTLVTTHLSAPWPDPFQGWRDDMARLATTLQQIAADSPGPVIVGGDLNSTTDMREFRRLLRDGYRDAAEQAGAGLTRTHPADLALPPVFAVDHILTRGCTATAVRTIPIARSDHQALAANVVLTHA